MIILYGETKKQLYDIFELYENLYSELLDDNIAIRDKRMNMDCKEQVEMMLFRTQVKIHKFKKMVERVEKEDEEERKREDEKSKKESEWRSEQLNHPG